MSGWRTCWGVTACRRTCAAMASMRWDERPGRCDRAGPTGYIVEDGAVDTTMSARYEEPKIEVSEHGRLTIHVRVVNDSCHYWRGAVLGWQVTAGDGHSYVEDGPAQGLGEELGPGESRECVLDGALPPGRRPIPIFVAPLYPALAGCIPKAAGRSWSRGSKRGCGALAAAVACHDGRIGPLGTLGAGQTRVAQRMEVARAPWKMCRPCGRTGGWHGRSPNATWRRGIGVGRRRVWMCFTRCC